MCTVVRKIWPNRFLGALGAVLVASTLVLGVAACSKGEHEVALWAVAALPDEKEITAGSTLELNTSEDLQFAVTVENQGNRDERDVKVMVTLVSATTPQQQMTVVLASIAAKQVTTVVVAGLYPSSPGEEATLTVDVGPVPNESDLDDNSLTATLIFVQ